MLEFERTVPPLIEPLMGWTESDDPLAPVRLHFPDLQSAIAFAERHGWRYQVHDESIPGAGSRAVRNAARYDISNVLAQVHSVSS
jgi:ETC complex I subunit-like protein